jgi:myo-inositol-1(or 4)-monophosphatase
MASHARERDVAVRAAREAGAIVGRYYASGVRVREKGPDNPVTKADLEANTRIRTLVAEAFPEDGWLSEETADSTERLGRRRVWIVDPLDGTKEFIERIPEFCVCIALVEAGRPVVAVSYNPAADRLYLAARGEGTTVNGAPAHVSRTARVADAVVLASRSEDKRGEWDPFKGRMRVQLTGSVAFKLAELATGAGDATFTLTPKNEWDICAGTLLVEEAGGTVTDLAGAPLVFNQPKTLRPGMIASNGVLHEALCRVIAEVSRPR